MIMVQCFRITTPFVSASRIRSLIRGSPCRVGFSSGAKWRCEHGTGFQSPKYQWVDGAEDVERYEPEGFHPVMVGDMLRGRYCVVDKLGFGGYSTVWLAQDTHRGEYVAVKVSVAGSCSLVREVQALRALSIHPGNGPGHAHGHDAIPSPPDEFEVRGPNGVHPCYTMVPARYNLRETSFSALFSLDVARALVGGQVMAVAHMHSCKYVHGDIHLRNILVKLPSSIDHLSIKQFYEEYGEPETTPITLRDGSPLPPTPSVPPKTVIPLYMGMDAEKFTLRDAYILLSDFGEVYSPLSETRREKDCHTPLAMRPPEARFEPRAALSYAADIWSLGVAIWEILGMKAIFSNEYVTKDEMVSQHIDVLGPMPTAWWECWEERGEFFIDDGRPAERELWPELELAFEQGVQHYRRTLEMGVFEKEETQAILSLMRRMLTFQPEQRLTIEEVLESEWIVKLVLPTWRVQGK